MDINLIGKQFGDLIVIERNYSYAIEKGLKTTKSAYWNCECVNCKKIYTKTTSTLNTQKDRITCFNCKSQIKEGNKYGMLTIIEKDKDYSIQHNIKSRQKYYKCKCDCGNIVTKRADYLLQQENPNCGCIGKINIRNFAETRIKDLVGLKFGFLTVLNRNKEKSSSGQIFWDCQCDYGNIISVCGKHLKRGATVSCGCIKQSYGELTIKNLLDENNIKYIQEYTIKEINNRRYDFAILNNENKVIRFIEYDGEQHFKPSSLFGGEQKFKERIESDNIKNQWAKNNNIPLVRINYLYKNKITIDMLLNDDSFLV